MRSLAFLVVAVALVGCAGARPPARAPRRPPRSDVVPWVNRPAAQPVDLAIPSWRRPPTPNSAPACRPGELALRRARSNGAMGTLYLSLVWVNRGTRSCRAVGKARIAAETPHGLLPLGPTRYYSFARTLNGPPADIAPGRTVVTTFGGTANCARGQEPSARIGYDRFRVGLPSGDTFAVHQPFESVCGVFGSAFGVPSARRPVHRLELGTTLHVPAVLRVGELHYRVTLTNPHSHPVRLDPCPTYVESLYGAHTTVRRRYVLNCDRVHEIGARSSVTYAMRIRVPARDVEKLAWSIDGRYAPGTAVPVAAD